MLKASLKSVARSMAGAFVAFTIAALALPQAALAGVARIGAAEYDTLAEAFAAASGATTIELLADCAGCGIVVPSGKDITVNFNGHSYTVNAEPLAGSGSTRNQCFQLLRDSSVTFRNGAIVADNAGIKMMIQNYADLTLSGMTLDATQGSNNIGYVLSTNNGSTTIDNTRIVARENGVAFDACCGWGGYESNEVEVTGNSQIVGDVEVSYYGQAGSTPATLALTSGSISGDIVMDQGGEAVEITKSSGFTQEAPDGFVWRDNGDGTSELVQFGFVRAIFKGNSLDTSSIWDAEDATVVSGVDAIIAQQSYAFPEYTTYAYGTYMYFEGGVTYSIGSYMDDETRIEVDGSALITTGSRYYAAFSYAESGWHKVELRFYNHSGPGGGYGLDGCSFCTEDGVWKRFDSANGQFRTDAPEGYSPVAPTIQYQGTGEVRNIDISGYTGSEIEIELGFLEKIPDNAFRNNKILTSVKIRGPQDPLGAISASAGENIGGYAFSGCTSLTSLEIHNASIGERAFQGCTGLTSLVIPTDVVVSGSYAFEGCSNLKSVDARVRMPANGANHIFENCTSLERVIVCGPMESSTFYNCSSLKDVTVLAGEIGYETFRDKTAIVSLTLGDEVTSIGQRAFSGCSGLSGTLTIPGSVTSIGNYAFYNCSGLTGTLTIPESVTSIGQYAFLNCSGITGVEALGGNLPYDAFNGCSSLLTVKVKGPVNSSMFNGCNSLKSAEILSGEIGNEVFKHRTELTTVILHEGVTFIGDYAFDCCRNLTMVAIPNSVTNIGSAAFRYCTGMTGKLVIPAGVKTIKGGNRENYDFWCDENGNVSGEYNLPKGAFSGCSGITSVALPDGIIEIGQDAFSGCTGLTGTLTIPESVTTIGQYAFEGCVGFDGSLTIEQGVTNIAAYAFCNCSGFTGSLTIPGSVTTIGQYAFEGCVGFDGSLTIEQGVANIAEYAFNGCSGFTGDLTIPGSVETIGPRAFEGCVGFDGSLTIEQGVTNIAVYAFCNCSGFTGDLTIPGSVETIGSRAFEGCVGFDGSLTIEQGVEIIGDAAFRYCRGFAGELIIPEGVKSIGGRWVYEELHEDGKTYHDYRSYGAFSYCTGFSSVAIPSTIESINRVFHNDIGIKTVTIAEGAKIIGGFSGCIGLTEIEIPNSVTNIDAYAFADCTELVNVNMPTDIKVIGEYAFSGCHKLLKLEWLPGVRVGQYAFQDCASWQGVFNVPTGVTEIAAGTFAGCSGLQQINLPDGITTIGNSAFTRCTSLTEIRLPQGLTEVSDYMFKGCHYLSKVIIPNSVRRIGSQAFDTCYSLISLEVPEGVTTLGWGIFCNGYTAYLTLPSTLTNVDRDVFWGHAPSQIIFTGDLPIGYERWNRISDLNVSFSRASGGRGLVSWPVTQFMGYTQTNAPTVTIISSKIRENDPEVLDVVYKVTSKKPTVKVRALAFENGVRSFANIVRPEDFIADPEGNETKGNVGDAVTANVEHTLSWKVSSDWATRLAKVSFEVLATEDDILPLELMTIPGTAAHPETWQISWNYITVDKSFEALLWLYADRDLGLTLRDGVLYNGDTRLCEGAQIKQPYDALVYIYGKMGFTLLDGDALDYVREATRFNLPDKSGRQYAYRVVTPAGE